jgi:hypothetical protein
MKYYFATILDYLAVILAWVLAIAINAAWMYVVYHFIVKYW